MPKKFVGENTKAIASRERKKIQKESKLKENEERINEELWKNTDKQSEKKQAKIEAAEKKKQEVKQKKLEAKDQLEKELASIKVKRGKEVKKLTRAEISSQRNEADAKNKSLNLSSHLEEPLERNLNKLPIDNAESARNIDDAILLLTDHVDEDRHPEKRMKAAYKCYEEKCLKDLKVTHPSLKLSQLKQMVFKNWKTAPENPLLQKM
ncbi:coiled-coil domain-containing protein 124-like [Diabrotica virgifera virgifera]|uniref:Coiled-coil domain-containing protein 124-like n=1 Tax=Diabrotica virgifera virgifera TaxID=50390 RepID=A0A6P7H198_DIAVI|nr:coiled-coil domain-containing protein 124-like [Diabrotica virgifera virgifera]